MKNIQNWEKFNESYNQEMINEGLIGDIIKLPFKILGFLLKPLVPLLLKVIGKSISIENKWEITKAVLDGITKLALDVEEAKKKLAKENSDLTPNERRELENKVEKFKKKYPNGFKFETTNGMKDAVLWKDRLAIRQSLIPKALVKVERTYDISE
jgi:FtsZ-binding cell division protein ZapB